MEPAIAPFRVTEPELRRAVLGPSAGARGDDDLNPGMARGPGRLRPAAVLCPVARRPQGLTVILTMRPSTMRHHAGQIAFPGGKVDPTDASPLAAALRESREEIGLMPDQLEVLGPLDRYETRTGFAITPFVGLVGPAFRAIPEPGEVEAVFEVPLDFLMNPANHRRMSREWQGTTRWFWAMPWGEWFVWGATAGMLRGLADRLAAVRGEPRLPARPEAEPGDRPAPPAEARPVREPAREAVVGGRADREPGAAAGPTTRTAAAAASA